MLSVILPASNEEAWIGGCLEALFASEPIEAEVIVVANGCHDRTAEVARGFAGRFFSTSGLMGFNPAMKRLALLR